MSTDLPCPDLQSLERLAQGLLTPEDVEPLAQHLEQCDRCAETLVGLNHEDTLVGAVQARRGVAGVADQPIVDALVEKLRWLPADLAASSQHATQEATGDSRATPSDASSEPIRQATTLPMPEAARELYEFLAPPERPDELGRLGPYRVLQVLGAGGMGVVFLAEDPQLERQVALKVMKPVLAVSEVARKRFLREAKATAAIENDHIVTIHQVSEDRGVPFIAMQLLHGETLEDRLQRIESARRTGNVSPEMPLPEVLRISREIAEGLAAAHSRRLVHRDIKPANIWLEERVQGSGVRVQRPETSQRLNPEPRTLNAPARVKIVDFGLARAASGDSSNLTHQGAIIGTPAYMAPEQANAGALDPRCDLFSLGCVLYRMTTGEVPFKGSTPLDTLLAVIDHTPKPPRELKSDVPPALSDLVMKLLAKNAADRPQSAHTVITAIESIERGLAQSRILPPSPPRDDSPRGNVIVAPSPLTPVATTPSPLRGEGRSTPAPGMRAVTFNCSSCGKRLKVKAELVGKQIKCPGCGQLVHIAQPPASPSVAAEKLSLPDSFDPYHKWLGIRDADRPPNHYRLLGLELFEDDLDVVADAAQRQMAHVRNFQLGPHAGLSQRVLNELATARVCLLDPDKKTKYDRQLRLSALPQTPAMPMERVAPVPKSSLKPAITQPAASPSVAAEKRFKGTAHSATSPAQEPNRTRGEATRPVAAARAARSLTVPLRKFAGKWPAVAAALLLAIALFFAPQVIRIVTNKGVIVVEVTDNAVEVLIKSEALTITDQASDQKYHLRIGRQNIPAGDYWLEVTSDAGLAVDTPEFKIARNGTQVIKVSLDRSVAAADTSPKTVVASQESMLPTVTTEPIDPKLRHAYMNRSGDWKIDGDELVQRKWDANCQLVFGDYTWKDLDLTCDVKRVNDSAELGLLYRVTGAGSGRVVSGSNFQQARSQVRGNFSELKRGTGGVEKGRWYRLGISLRGMHCQYFLDDKLVVEYEDEKNPQGAVGLLTSFGVVRFRNIRVTDPAGKVLFDGLPELPASAGQWLPATEPASASELQCLKGHDCPVTGVTFSRDGRQILSCSDGETLAFNARQDGGTRVRWFSPASSIRLWDAATGEQSDSFSIGGARGFVKLALAPQASRFLSHIRDQGEVRLWSVAGGKLQHQSNLPGGAGTVLNLAFTPDGRRARGLAPTGAIWEWDLNDLILARRFPGTVKNVSCTAISPDASRALLARNNQPMAEIDLETGKETGRWKEAVGIVRSMAIAPDGSRVVTGGEDGTVRLWEMADAKHLHLIGAHQRPVLAVAISPDGRRALTGGDDQTVRLWDLDSKKELARFTGHTAAVLTVALSPDGLRAASGSADYTVRLWRLPPTESETAPAAGVPAGDQRFEPSSTAGT